MLYKKIIFLFALLAFFSAEAQGQASFPPPLEPAEQNYEKTLKNKEAQADYAAGLIDKGNEADGLSLLIDLSKSSVYAAFLAAEYFMEKELFYGPGESEEDAVKLYERALHLIEEKPERSSGGHAAALQIELRSLMAASFLYYIRFLRGYNDSYIKNLQDSPSYKGDKSKLELAYEEGRSSNTQKNLEGLFKSSVKCLSADFKSHFKKAIYDSAMSFCGLLLKSSWPLALMNQKRLELLEDEACAKDILQCFEFQLLRKDTLSALNLINDQLNYFFDRFSVHLESLKAEEGRRP